MFKPSKHISTVRQDCALLLYALVKGFELDVGKMIKESILDYAENNFSGNIPHLALITLLCIKGGIKVAEEEEKSPKASHLTLTGVLKTPTEGEEVERIRKRRRTEEQLRDRPYSRGCQRIENEEKGVFEYYTEQSVLFPTTTEEIAAPPIKTENKGKKRAEAEDSSSFELLVLMKEMREEMRIRDEQLREELRWRDENQCVENKRR